ncbi:sulfite exporter TauE/SafE family protein [Rufibacter sp. LB8]|uniref:sulfite exporter TauE/SafE family protein n=1 Tax=Rufibacter sp. LB8 TaxID=2777781 RepID=UPI00178C29EF|nr:sulfite exporter TauE/SafE family protein [Rufibacter sp. LB8]
MIWAGFLFGILGSFHCVGMCGPIAMALPMGKGAGFSFLSGRLLYNLGRIISYTALGAVAGLLGQSFQLAGFQQGLSIFSGVLILVLVVVPAAVSGKFRQVTGVEALLQKNQKAMGHFFKNPSWWSMGAIGLLNGLLPCGFVYFAMAGAVSMPSVPAAMGYMALFGLGTFPLMFLLSVSGKLVGPGLRRFFKKSIPYAATFMAVLFILRGLNLGIPYVSPQLAQTEAGEKPIATCHSPR